MMDEDTAGFLTGTVIVIIAIFLVIALGVGGFFVQQWWTRTTAPVIGKTQEIQSVNSGTNRIVQQEHFETLNGDIKGYVIKIHQTKQTADAETDPTQKQHWTVILNGLESQCADATAQYNADAHKVSASPWQSADVPYQIPTGDPSYDCSVN